MFAQETKPHEGANAHFRLPAGYPDCHPKDRDFYPSGRFGSGEKALSSMLEERKCRIRPASSADPETGQ
jgi:hypothetical protein